MPLSQDQLDAVMRHVRGTVTNGCPMCGRRDWSIDEELHFTGVLDSEYREPVQGQLTPLIMVTCKNCLFSYHLPAMKLGLL